MIGLRPAVPADADFCYLVHRAAMKAYIEAVWGWVEADQRALHDRGFDPSRTRIVTVDGEDAGLLIVEDTPEHVYVGRIEIRPEHQGRGAGSHLIGELLRDRPVELDVLAVNPRAHALYRRLGFQDVRDDGIRTRMRWSPRTERGDP
ncbi:GNAT family N-acetyltransferase [Actinoplanes sp. NPDC051343]|jgi:ribosomal protein S18 acetylase RimI-like enzyme|uniref:GNAT family N-acetyltransferase n=1 Tax=Actinoplanes sp. NPDC051343 TaxID=3363906 RepID=UPI00379C19F2